MAVSTLQTDVELKLRQAGIRVVSRIERLSIPGAPYLYVNVNMLQVPAGVVAYSVHVELVQLVRLERDASTSILGTTWGTGRVGTVGMSQLSTLRGPVRDCVDKFLNAYLEANPR